jgi:hypothetical protein
MNIEDTGRIIIELLGLPGDAGNRILEALDTRYNRAPPKIIESQMRLEQIGDVVVWHGKPHRVGKCADAATQCFACDRLGKHLESIEEPSVVVVADPKSTHPTGHSLRVGCACSLCAAWRVNSCTRCGVHSKDPAYMANGCFHTHYGEYTGFSTAVVDATMKTEVRPVVEHCLGNHCADKAACECLCEKCNPPHPTQGDPT